MKRFSTIFLGIVLLHLILTSQASAIATYDYISDVTITFGSLWDDYTVEVTSTTSGTGQYTASTAPFVDGNLQEFSCYQVAHVVGSAGDDILFQSGTSHSYNQVKTSFTFDFDSTPTDFTITLMDWNQVLVSSKQLNLWNPDNQTGEYIGYWPGLGGGGSALGLALDGAWFAIPNWIPGDSTIFHNLVGQHTVLIMTSADETAIAGYPYVKTPEPTTLLLLGLGLLGLTACRRKFKKQFSIRLSKSRRGVGRLLFRFRKKALKAA